MTTVLYFASLREKLGAGREKATVPPGVDTVAKLVDWLRTLSSVHAEAFADMKTVRVAVNQEHTSFDAAIKEGDEIAFFPPVTGG